MTYRRLTTSVLLGLTFLSMPLQNSLAKHAQVLTPDIEFSCDQPENSKTIECAYRFIEPDITTKISATLGQTELPILDIKTYPFENSSTSILFLVDRSKAENVEQIQQIRNHLNALAEQALPYQQIGLATFDNSLKIISPLGSTPEEIISATDDIIETEQPTELYRNILDALELLKVSPSDRKAVYLFSNGQSNDQAIYHSDVVKAANASAIRIISIQYPDASDSTENEQALRSLSTDTGGSFFKASTDDLELSEDFLADPFAAIDNGGVLTLDLEPVLSGEHQGVQVAMLVFNTSRKKITVKLPLELSSVNNATGALLTDNGSVETDILNQDLIDEDDEVDEKSSELETVDAKIEQKESHEAPIEDRSISYQQPENQDPDVLTKVKTFPFLDYIPFIVGGLFLISLLIFLFSRKKKPQTIIEELDDGKPLAYLVSLNDDSHYYPIYRTPWKVGRVREKDLFLEHSSVSRNHAEFKRNRDGSFTVTDLDSLNGVYINNTKISTGMVKDQDKVDIGDVRLKFILDKKTS